MRLSAIDIRGGLEFSMDDIRASEQHVQEEPIRDPRPMDVPTKNGTDVAQPSKPSEVRVHVCYCFTSTVMSCTQAFPDIETRTKPPTGRNQIVLLLPAYLIVNLAFPQSVDARDESSVVEDLTYDDLPSSLSNSLQPSSLDIFNPNVSSVGSSRTILSGYGAVPRRSIVADDDVSSSGYAKVSPRTSTPGYAPITPRGSAARLSRNGDVMPDGVVSTFGYGANPGASNMTGNPSAFSTLRTTTSTGLSDTGTYGTLPGTLFDISHLNDDLLLF